MKKLLIVESPAKIKTISKFLGKDFKIMSTMGHIMDLPQKELGISINKEIKIDYVILEGKEKTVAEICAQAQKSDAIYLAPDPDREGEIIAWHVASQIEKVLKNPEIIHRITFNEITSTAVENAVAHPSTIDLNKVAAQQARRVLDRLVGYEVSPILWKKIAKGLSAGRVQSVALKLIVDREEAIKNFKQEEYWSIEAAFKTEAGNITAQLALISKKKATIPNEKSAKELIEKIEKTDFLIESVKDSKRLKHPAPPFMTSTLQQSAYNQLGFQVQKTMQIAQKLYEGMPLKDPSTPVALITYMRTDSLRIADSAIKQARDYIGKNYSKDYLPASAQMYSKDKGQDAHEAIRPIDVRITPDDAANYLPAEAAKLYALIWKRFVASQIKPAQFAQRQVTIYGSPYTFRVTGSTLLFDGFLKVYGEEVEEDSEKEGTSNIPAGIKEKMDASANKITPKQHFTQPPPRYTEATLVKEMEKEGIGRPSTYATIMKTIQARSYTSLDPKKKFLPTELGVVVTKMLTENLPKIMDVKFTAMMEQDLDKIAQGALKRDDLIKGFNENFEKDLEIFAGESVKKQVEKTDIICPKCQEGHLVIRFGKSGPFAGCDKYPTCNFTSNFTREADGTISLLATQEPKLLKELCPKCKKPLRQLQGKFGTFIACSGYPECTYIKPTIANFKCPNDGGDVIKRMWKGSTFWGCSNYPKCKFSISGDIEQIPCPNCKTPYLLKKVDKQGNITLICSNKTCGYVKEIKN